MFDRIRSFGARRVAVIVLATGLVAIVAVPTILAASAPASPSPVSTGAQIDQPAAPAATAAPAADKPARLGRILRGDATVLKRDGSTATVHFERGEITAASPTSVTIKGADGTSTTFAITADTRIRSQGHRVTADALKVGGFAAVLTSPASSKSDALLIRVRAAKPTP
jgi:hypothetical protein